MSIREQEAPEFSYALRGYDRVEVDEYVAWLRDYAIAIEERAAAAELSLAACRTELASPGGSGFSQRLDAILQLANEEAADIRAQAQAAAEAMREEAATDAARMLSEASEQRDAIQREVDDLLTIREHLVQRLVDLGSTIRVAQERYEGSVPGATTAQRGDVELFDGEALEVEDRHRTEGIADDGDAPGEDVGPAPDSAALAPSGPVAET